ncbi:tryptophan synthase subunit alpha [Candidatus Vidania fulgoroideorum]
MKIVPFLIPFFPNKKKFRKIIYFLKAKKVIELEIGIPCLNCFLDGKYIAKSYRFILKKYKYNIKKIFLEFLRFFEKLNFKIILVVYSEFIYEYNKKKFFKKINKFKINKIIVVDFNIKNYKKNICFLKKVKPIYLFPINYSKNIIIKKTNSKTKTNIYLYLANKTGKTAKLKKINKQSLSKKKFFYYTGFGINNRKVLKKLKIFNKIVIGTKFLKIISKKNFKKKIIKYVKNKNVKNKM